MPKFQTFPDLMLRLLDPKLLGVESLSRPCWCSDTHFAKIRRLLNQLGFS